MSRLTWSIKNSDAAKLDAFGRTVWRWLLGVNWSDHITNESLMRMIDGIWLFTYDTIVQRKMDWFSHIARQQGLQWDLLSGAVLGTVSSRGRPRMTWYDNIRASTGLTMEEAKQQALSRIHLRVRGHQPAPLRRSSRIALRQHVAGKTRCQVLVRVHSTDDLLLCTLVDGLIFQQNLNLTLMPGEKATFHAKGGIHLNGYSKSHLEDNSQLFRDEEREDNISQTNNENQNRICESSPIQVKQEILDNHSLDSLDVCAPSDKKTSLVSVKTEGPDEGSCSSQQEQPESSSADAHDESVPFTCDIQTTTDTSTQHPDVECIQEAIALSRSPSPVPEHHNIPATEQNEVQNHQMLLLQVSQRQFPFIVLFSILHTNVCNCLLAAINRTYHDSF
ncbi:endonuclease-reverse transcriptase [Apostichopus japonicus]|uniref:Endonuclease-reverse transcriptase n=1 Tax=Stichopus japonicus TaxID=307972 RepID=A0A2G8L2P5_STIJA|nr:endonuclease-reverse transcriptase [Apostichopus japonicus]